MEILEFHNLNKNKLHNTIQEEELHFQDLMLLRVHEILLVASSYDSFILEEEGQLTEQILQEYIGMSLNYAPRVSRSSTAKSAFNKLIKRSFDMVIIMLRISDMDPIQFAEKIRKKYPKTPVFLLAFDESEIKQLPVYIDKIIDKIFLWTGDASVFPAIIKYYEDKKNIARDIAIGNVRTIILIEDTARYYSTLLPLLYKEIIFHTKKLMDKSLNDTQRLLHMRARPKILHAVNYEEAQKYFDKYQMNILGVISDVKFPNNDKLDSLAGIKFAKYIQSKEDSIPILLQTSNTKLKATDHGLNTKLLYKDSKKLFKDIKFFMKRHLGFDEFIFRNNKGEEICSVDNISDMLSKLESIPDESIYFHASNNHFSNWIAARGKLTLASSFRSIKVSDYKSNKKRRDKYIELIKDDLKYDKSSKISIFDKANTSNFMKIGRGSLGGKARGLAFANSYIKDLKDNISFKNVIINVPKTLVITTDEFDYFMNNNKLWDLALTINDNSKLIDQFQKADLSKKTIDFILDFLKETETPLAIRSSSLSEDSQYQPLSGMYSTFMIPNFSKDINVRLNHVLEAIKRIFASTFFQEPKSIIDKTVQRYEEEKMAIIIMEMVGKKHGKYFYPTFSGVAQSYNYYPVSHMKRREGVAFVALGLGKTVVDGDKSLRISPYYPNILPQYYSIRSIIENSQNNFYALSMDLAKDPLKNGESGNLSCLPINIAEKDGELKFLGSVISENDNNIRDSLNYDGMRVITFSSVLKYNRFPLCDILKSILKSGELALGCPIEVEFAVNLNDNSLDKFSILQIKPMVVGGMKRSNDEEHAKNSKMLCKSSSVLGDGNILDIKNILYIDEEDFDRSKTKNIANDIGRINKELGEENPYLIIGPGRWGTADPWLGIPVSWKQISNAKAIIEMGIENLNPDPSFGSHFFQNITSLHIGYFTIKKQDCEKNIDLNWLRKTKSFKKTKYIKWIQLQSNLIVKINGATGNGTILSQDENSQLEMNEELSPGI